MNRSSVSAPVVVKLQAMCPLWPSTRNGTPGAVAPTRTLPGHSSRARYHTLGKPKPRCGSPASSGAPVALCLPSIAQALLASCGRVKGAGKSGTTAASATAKRTSAGVVNDASGWPPVAVFGHSSSTAAGGMLASNTSRARSARQFPDRYSAIVLPHSRLSTAVQGRGAPKATNSGAANRPRAAIQALTPRA